MKISRVQILSHIFFIFAFLALPYIFAPTGFPGLAELESNSHERTIFTSFLFMLVFFYANYYYLIPRFYFTKKYILYLGIIVLYFFLVMLFVHLLDAPDARMPFPDHPPAMTPHPKMMPYRKPPSAFDNSQALFLFLVGLVVSFALRINDRLKRSEQEKLHTELSYLKAQINPHFLFNTLNSIYSLAIEKSDRTADAVVMLSSLMRYVIRDASESLVPLDKEIEYIRNYVSLQQFRLDDTVFVDFHVTGQVFNKKIAPLILISFIENAFKYGVNPELKSVIRITITLDQDLLILHVVNNKVRTHAVEESSGGIGIENTRARLQLLYPSKHNLQIQDNSENFIVDLNLNLS